MKKEVKKLADFPIGSNVGGHVGSGKARRYRMGVVREHGENKMMVEDRGEQFVLFLAEAERV